MTPKEKAEQLVNEHNELCVFNCNLDSDYGKAKKGALICVREILNEPKMKLTVRYY